MHETAINIVEHLSEKDKRRVYAFFNIYYATPTEHIWSITKLYTHAMYIPMLLQIGMSHFNRIIYIDTHAGPGLAKIGSDEKEIILGSPLIAVEWPRIVASRVSSFRKVSKGFDDLFFVEVNLRTLDILKTIVESSGVDKDKLNPIHNDCNRALPELVEDIAEDNEKTLVYIFADPYGEINTQLKAKTIEALANLNFMDMIITFHAPMIARAFSQGDRRKAELLYGEGFCDQYAKHSRVFCEEGGPNVDQVIKAYRSLLNRSGFRTIKLIPVRFEKGIIYYLLIASKRGGARWLSGFINYINKKVPDYKKLKILWLKQVRKYKTLDEFL